MVLKVELERKLELLKPILYSTYYVEKIGVFGSFARGEQTKNSDVDILVSFYKPIGWAFFDLKEFLEKELDRKVDLVTKNAIKRQLESTILSEVQYI